MTRREWMVAMLIGPLATQFEIRSAAQAGDLTTLAITDAAARIGRRTLTPVALVDAYLDRIAQLDPQLHAFITLTAARARADARRQLPNQPSPLFGIPIAHKDLFETAGVRTTAGSMLFDKYIPSQDAAIVRQLSRAGAVTLGKTNTHELGGGVTTINPFYGTTRNPADPSRIAGGSSGGSAAAVAARMCAAATGSDTGGSIRIPAALCGCVGFKPTFGRISTQGLLGACPTFDHVGFLARTVEDMELVFNAALPVPGSQVAVPDKFRVGIPRTFFYDSLAADVAHAVDLALGRARERGATVTDIAFPIDATTMARVFDPIVAWEIWERWGPDWKMNPSLFSPAFSEFFKSERPAIAHLEDAQRELARFRTEVDRAFDGVDVIVTPTVPITAPLITGPIDGNKILRNTWPFNAAGTPAISVPCGNDDRALPGGLPIGLQIVGRKNMDEVVLRAARLFAERPSRAI